MTWSRLPAGHGAAPAWRPATIRTGRHSAIGLPRSARTATLAVTGPGGTARPRRPPAASPRGVAAASLRLTVGAVQQLAEQRAGERLDDLQLPVGQPGQPTPVALDLGPAHVLGPGRAATATVGSAWRADPLAQVAGDRLLDQLPGGVGGPGPLGQARLGEGA